MTAVRKLTVDDLLALGTDVRAELIHGEVIPKAMQSAVTTRMKIVADLDVAETRVPQDGRATVSVGGRQVNLRHQHARAGHGLTNRDIKLLAPGMPLGFSGFVGAAGGSRRLLGDQLRLLRLGQ